MNEFNWIDWALNSEKPSNALKEMQNSGELENYPELAALVGCLQNPKWHQEDVFEHTYLVCDQCRIISLREKLNETDTLVLVFSGICHDLAKPKTTIGIYPDLRSPMHAEKGERVARNFLKEISVENTIIERVCALVRCHMRYLNTGTVKAVRKLEVDLKPSNINELCLLIEADSRGRIPKGDFPEQALKMLELSKKDNIVETKPRRILEGRHLKELGLTPNETFGKMIKECYEKQINGEIKTLEEALNWAKIQQIKIS